MLFQVVDITTGGQAAAAAAEVATAEEAAASAIAAASAQLAEADAEGGNYVDEDSGAAFDFACVVRVCCFCCSLFPAACSALCSCTAFVTNVLRSM